MADPNQGFYLPEEKAGDYESAEAFQTYWKPPNGSTLEYVIEDLKMGTSKAGEPRVEVIVAVASGEYAGSKPAPHSWPHKPNFLGRWKELNLATGVNPQRDSSGRIPTVPAWYIGKRFIATAIWREEPSTRDPTKMVTYCDLKNLLPVPQQGADAQAQVFQQQPQMSAQPQQQPVFQQQPQMQQAAPQQQQAAPQMQAVTQPAFAPNAAPPTQAQPQFANMAPNGPQTQPVVRRPVPGT